MYTERYTDKLFFIPFDKVDDDEDHIAEKAENLWEDTWKWAHETTGWEVSDRRIYSIKYRHEGKLYYAEVGLPDPRVEEKVLVILQSNTFLVCTYNRGVIRGGPVLVGKNEAIEVTYFREKSVPDLT